MEHKTNWMDGDIVRSEDLNRIENNNKILEATKANKTITKNITLEAAGWTGNEPPYSYTISLEEVTADNNIEVTYPQSPTQEVYEQLTSAGLCGGSQAAGSMTLLAYGDKPVIDMPVTIFVKGD